MRQAGYDVREAGTGAEALRLARELSPEIVLLDVNLPDMNGVDVCRELRRDPATAAIAVVHVSATAVEAPNRARGLEFGADAYLVEPVDRTELLATVQSVLRRRLEQQCEREGRRRAEEEAGRLARLQTALAALGEAATQEQVLDAIAETVLKAADASAALVLLLDGNTEELIVRRAIGQPCGSAGARISVRAASPMADAVRLGEPVLLGSAAERDERYPGLVRFFEFAGGDGAFVAAPLILRDQPLGAFCLRFPSDAAFNASDRDFFSIIARECAQALVRASLYDGERALRQEFESEVVLTQRLIEAQKLETVGQLAAGVAHRYNNWLMGIMGSLSLVLPELPSGGREADLVQRALTSAEKMADITRQLLSYSGRGRFVLERVDLTGAVRDCEELLRAACPRTIVLSLDLAESLPLIEADPNQIQQVVLNLVSNAVEAIGASPGGAIQVRTAVEFLDEAAGARFPGFGSLKPGQYVCLAVEDNGCGMNDSTRSRIFDPFFTTKFLGRGLGLAAVAGMVRSQRGGVRVESAPGEGSTFSVYLPVAGGPAA